MNKTTTIIGVIAVIALLLAVWAKVTPATMITSSGSQSLGAVSNTNGPAAGTVLADGVLLPNPTVYDYLISRAFLYTDKALGFGNATNVPTLEQGVRVVLATASTVPCALQNPFTATSTFGGSFTVTVGTSSAGTLAIGTTTSATATSTTPLGTPVIAANTQITIPFSSGNVGTVGPSQWVTIGMTNGSSVGFGYTYGGVCQARFVTTN